MRQIIFQAIVPEKLYHSTSIPLNTEYPFFSNLCNIFFNIPLGQYGKNFNWEGSFGSGILKSSKKVGVLGLQGSEGRNDEGSGTAIISGNPICSI